MIKKALLALAMTSTMAMAQATVVVNEGFDQVAVGSTPTGVLQSKGWIVSNMSTAGGLVPGWFQGDADKLTSQSGADNSYLAANYNNAPAGGTLNNLLETPVFRTDSGVIVSFFLNAAADAGYFDQIAFGFVDASGVFTTALTNLVTVTTGQWTEYTLTLAATDGFARFAIDYTGAADTANYVGLDSLTVTVPEPSSIAILVAGLIGFGAARRRQQRG